ncbi:hypothetical protein ES703_51240 [subsurface metagenome]
MHKGELKEMSHPPLRLHRLLSIGVAADTLPLPLLAVALPATHAAVNMVVSVQDQQARLPRLEHRQAAFLSLGEHQRNQDWHIMMGVRRA